MKNFLKSKTIWANILMMAAVIFTPETIASFGLTPEQVTLVMGVFNLILRFVSNKGITIGAAK